MDYREHLISTQYGRVSLIFPVKMTAECWEDTCDWLAIVQRQFIRYRDVAMKERERLLAAVDNEDEAGSVSAGVPDKFLPNRLPDRGQ